MICMESARKGREVIRLGPIHLIWDREEEGDITSCEILLEEQGFGARV